MECKCIQGIWVNTDVCRELIETLWNVNYITEEQAQKINEGINRNIVECKSKYCSDSFCKQIELIETLWNVNKFTNVKFDSNS